MPIQALRHYAKTLVLLYVEDDQEVASKLLVVLKTFFGTVVHVSNGEEGLAAYQTLHPHLVLSDISMPKMNGIQMCQAIKALHPKQRFIFSTAYSESHLLMEAIALNVDGYVLKPINHDHFLDLLGRVCRDICTHIEHQFYQANLERAVKEKTLALQEANTQLLHLNHEIHHTLENTIVALGGIAESRSHETGLHVKRVALYAEFFAKELGLFTAQSDTLRIVAPMHDIGKIAIEDHILKKPGKLTEEEYVRMQAHARIGYEMLQDSALALFKDAAVVAYEHHEKFDGTGYPRKLKGENIHIFGRIVAFADVFDALISERVYKKPWPLERIVAFVKEQEGRHFDPAIVQVFLRHQDFFVQTNGRLMDTQMGYM